MFYQVDDNTLELVRTYHKKPRRYQRGTNFPRNYDDDDLIEELGCNYAQACNYLKKSWIKFKIAKRTQDEISMDEAIETINNIQRALGIPTTDFEAYEGPVEVEEEE